MQRAGVSAVAYRIATIDGFAMRLVAMFPARSGLNVEVLQLRNRGTDYPAIRQAACQLLQAGHLNDILAASYAHLIVDEYQDCNLVQHALVTALSTVLPACVLGDPMQAIFGFRGTSSWTGMHMYSLTFH
jgi:DNA helicase-2/ATP-dependent DNA helicase PcrA